MEKEQQECFAIKSNTFNQLQATPRQVFSQKDVYVAPFMQENIGHRNIEIIAAISQLLHIKEERQRVGPVEDEEACGGGYDGGHCHYFRFSLCQ